MIAAILGLITLITSTLTGIFGLGGGILLLGIMPIFLPIAAVIPVHGATQLASNASRAYFSWRSIRWQIMPTYLLGGVIGTLLALRWFYRRFLWSTYPCLSAAIFCYHNGLIFLTVW